MNRFSKGRFITIMETFKEIKTAGMEALAWKSQLTREAYPRNYERGVKWTMTPAWSLKRDTMCNELKVLWTWDGQRASVHVQGNVYIHVDNAGFLLGQLMVRTWFGREWHPLPMNWLTPPNISEWASGKYFSWLLGYPYHRQANFKRLGRT